LPSRKAKLTKRKRVMRRECSVLIAKPHNIEHQTDERVNQFIMKAFCIEKLLGLNKDVVAGITPIVRDKGKDIRCMWSAVVGGDNSKETIGIDQLPNKLFKVKRVGGTTLLIKRRVLEKLEKPYQKTTYNENMTDVSLSEDYYFSDKIRDAGFEIWVDPTEECDHYHIMNLRDVFDIYRQSRNAE